MMKKIAIAALSAAFLTGATPAGAAVGVAPLADAGLVQTVSGDCNAIARQLAAEYGGRARGTTQNRGGKQVCVVVILVDGKNNERGQRIERVIPLGN